MKRRSLLKYLFAGHVLFVLSACYALQPAQEKQPAGATLNPTQGQNISGWVQFQPDGWGHTRVRAEIKGLLPGAHGFHIHEYGDCSAPDASSAGGHFAPHKQVHGSPTAGAHHMGDLGNLMADVNGVARIDQRFDHLTLKGKKSLVGRAVIVHQSADDLKSQPSGAAGKRVACGVIGMLAADAR